MKNASYFKEKNARIFTIFVAVLFLLQFTAACVLTVSRYSAESQDKRYVLLCDSDLFSCISDKSSLSQMGVSSFTVELDADGALDEALCSEALSYGLSVVPVIGDSPVSFEDYKAACYKYDSRLFISGVAGLTSASAMQLDGLFYENGFIRIQEETDNQLGNVQVPPLSANDYNDASARLFDLRDVYRARYSYIGYTQGEEITNILYRAVSEREIRVILLRPFLDAMGDTITDSASYSSVVSSLEDRLSDKGYTVSDEPSVLGGTFHYEKLMGYAHILFVAASLAVLLLLLRALLPFFGNILCFCAWLLAFAAALLLRWRFPELFREGVTFLTAVSMSCLIYYLVYAALKKLQASTGNARVVLTAVLPLILVLICGIVVGASMYSLLYKLEIYYFVGVKLSMIVPIAFAIALFVKDSVICPDPEDRLISKKSISDHKGACAAIALIIIVAGIYYILRIGDFALTSSFELRVRNLLEQNLYARPRTKEILIGYPAFFAAFYLAVRKNRYYHLPLIFFSILTASAMNTFCHSRAPLAMGLFRSVGSYVLGAVIAVIAILVFAAVQKLFDGKNSSRN